MIVGISLSVGLGAYFLALMAILIGNKTRLKRVAVRITALTLPLVPLAAFYLVYPSGSCPGSSCAGQGVPSGLWSLFALFLAWHLFAMSKADDE